MSCDVTETWTVMTQVGCWSCLNEAISYVFIIRHFKLWRCKYKKNNYKSKTQNLPYRQRFFICREYPGWDLASSVVREEKKEWVENPHCIKLGPTSMQGPECELWCCMINWRTCDHFFLRLFNMLLDSSQMTWLVCLGMSWGRHVCQTL